MEDETNAIDRMSCTKFDEQTSSENIVFFPLEGDEIVVLCGL
jgi:hypothetical protein